MPHGGPGFSGHLAPAGAVTTLRIAPRAAQVLGAELRPAPAAMRRCEPPMLQASNLAGVGSPRKSRLVRRELFFRPTLAGPAGRVSWGASVETGTDFLPGPERLRPARASAPAGEKSPLGRCRRSDRN
jgi:hypothetical protein